VLLVLPFDSIEFGVFFDLIVYGLTILVGDVAVDDFDGVLGEELLDLQ
jgi:hypothetical protein